MTWVRATPDGDSSRYWRDLHARIRGPIVLSLQEVFRQDWYHSTGDDLVSAAYFPPIPGAGNIWAQLLASVLFLSEGTVRNYVSSILSKLSVSNRAEAAAYAVQHHLKDYL